MAYSGISEAEGELMRLPSLGVMESRRRGTADFSTASGRKDEGIAYTLEPSEVEPNDLWNFARTAFHSECQPRLELSESARYRIVESAEYVEKVIRDGTPVYGINTGFGHFTDVLIPEEKAIELQYNIVRSHCCGVGDTLPRDIVMGMWLVQLSSLCQGLSGVRLATIDGILNILNAGILARVPSQGSVGASGDLAPMSHAVRAMIGEGECSVPRDDEFVIMPAAEAIREAGLTPIRLGPKEGLSLVNGTSLSTSLALKAWFETKELLRVANATAAMTIEALGGARQIASARTAGAHRHPGTAVCASQLVSWLDTSSEINDSHKEDHWIQDPYSLRCVPQVHGAVWEELDRAEQDLAHEIAAATDNPLVFARDDKIKNGGNFHAIYVARVSDRLASALTTLANISERRICQLMQGRRGRLPTFLIDDGGVNSGFMMAQVTAAALVSESKSKSFPASVDSIPTNCGQEDHVSMGPIAGMKANEIVDNARRVLAIELLAAAQAIDLRAPHRPSEPLSVLHASIRRFVPMLERDRSFAEDFQLVEQKLRDRQIVPTIS